MPNHKLLYTVVVYGLTYKVKPLGKTVWTMKGPSCFSGLAIVSLLLLLPPLLSCSSPLEVLPPNQASSSSVWLGTQRQSHTAAIWKAAEDGHRHRPAPGEDKRKKKGRGGISLTQLSFSTTTTRYIPSGPSSFLSLAGDFVKVVFFPPSQRDLYYVLNKDSQLSRRCQKCLLPLC